MKIRAFNVLLAAMLAALVLTACGGTVDAGADTTAPTEAVTTAAAVQTPPALCFKSGETLIWAGADPSVLSALGEPQDKLEAASCVHEGFDRVYYYAGFEVNTQPTADGREVIVSIYLTDDSVCTPEGIYIGDKLDAAKAAYGELTADGSTYTCTKTEGGVTAKVNFVTNADGAITSIFYN